MDIEHWTPEQINQFQNEHPDAQPKPWVVMDGITIFGFYDTKEEAKETIRSANFDDKLQNDLTDFIDAHTDAEHTGYDITKLLREMLP